jgi:hypothetical protein
VAASAALLVEAIVPSFVLVRVSEYRECRIAELCQRLRVHQRQDTSIRGLRRGREATKGETGRENKGVEGLYLLTHECRRTLLKVYVGADGHCGRLISWRHGVAFGPVGDGSGNQWALRNRNPCLPSIAAPLTLLRSLRS